MEKAAAECFCACCNWALKNLQKQLGYAAEVGESVKDLETAMKSLKARSKDVNDRIKADQRIDPTMRPAGEVEVWLERVGEIENKVNSITADYEKSRCRCHSCSSVNVYSNWKIGRNATKELVTVKDEFQKGGNFIKEDKRVTKPRTPPPGQQMPGTSNFYAGEFNLHKVLGYLADGVRTIGIWGMGGVGKSKLLKAINNELSAGGRNNMRFDHVIYVEVSRHHGIQKVQEDIAKCLKLPFPKDASCNDIFNVLKNKKFIILLDHVWERLDLVAMGIPDHRVVLFATRSKDVCGQMDADKKVEVECLQNEDAWRLFMAKVGEEIISSSSEIEKLAKEVAKECKGLPLALIVIGRTMSSKHTLQEWRNTLTSLKKSHPVTTDIEERVFSRLKISYDNLPNEATRKCFLLCALDPEDYFFGTNELIEYFWGHGLIDDDGCNNVGEIYDRGYFHFIGFLKSVCLLETNGAKEREKIKMHDVIRYMGLWIARDCGRNNTKWVVRAGLNSEEPLRGIHDWEKAERLSLQKNCITDIPMPKTRCEKLSSLILQFNYELVRIPKDYFKFFPALSYLNLSHTAITQLPEEVSSLIGLQYLDLSRTNIESLSMNLSNLKKLKHLRLRYCDHLNYIPYGLISCLPLLQFLDIYGGAYSFDSESFIRDEEERNENLSIQYYIKNDECESQIVSNEVVPRKANLDELRMLKQHQRIKFMALNLKMKSIHDLQNVVDVGFVQRLILVALQDSNPKDFIVALLKVGNSIEVLELNNFVRLEELMLIGEQIQHGKRLNNQNLCFSRLSGLVLAHLHVLHKITWTKLMLLEVFPKLTSVNIESCHGLTNLTWTGYLPCLDSLIVINCKGLEEIISVDEIGERSSSSIFPNLQNIFLSGLQKLHNIFKGILDNPKLNHLIVRECPNLKRLPFDFQSQRTNKRGVHIRGNLEWWKGLEWDDDTIKSYLQHSMHFLASG